MKRAVIVLSATLLALEAAAIQLRCIDAAPVILPAQDAAQVTKPDVIVTGVCDFGGCPVATTEEISAVVNDILTTEHVSESYTLPAPVWLPEEEPEDPVWETFSTVEYFVEALYSPEYFCKAGLIDWNGWTWSWYSERVLPGGGLDIPGRHTVGGYVRDGDGYICLASDVLDYGTVIETPFGSAGRVYDCGVGNDNWIDVYVSW